MNQRLRLNLNNKKKSLNQSLNLLKNLKRQLIIKTVLK
jgi:hypothetical protein